MGFSSLFLVEKETRDGGWRAQKSSGAARAADSL